jgi:hypothetical protein
MIRHRDRNRRRALPPLLIAVMGGALASCGRVPGQFQILQNQVPDPGCTISGMAGAVYRGQGNLDLSLVGAGADSAYVLFPLVENNLTASPGGQVDTNEIHVHSFAVDIGTTAQSYLPPNVQTLFNTLNSMPGSADYALLHYSTPWAATVKSGGGTAATFVNAFPVQLAQRVLATGDIGISANSMVVNTRVRVFGTTANGSIESDPFDYPIYVCAGCLVTQVLPCPYAQPPANTGNVCNIAQDNSVDCCSLNGNLICPAVVGTSP